MSDILNVNWRFIPGTNKSYSVSDTGLVRSNDRIITYKTGAKIKYRGRIIKPWLSTTGYKVVSLGLSKGLTASGKRKKYTVHSLVLEAFKGKRPDDGSGCDIRHLDGNPLNNSLNNLQYGTRSENVQDSIKHGQRCFRKLSKSKVIEICKLGHTKVSATTVAKTYGVSRGTIVDIWVGRVCSKYTKGIRPEHRKKIKYDKLTEEQKELIKDYSLSSRKLETMTGISRGVIENYRVKFLGKKTIIKPKVIDTLKRSELAILRDPLISQRKAASMLGICRSVVVRERKKLIKSN